MSHARKSALSWLTAILIDGVPMDQAGALVKQEKLTGQEIAFARRLVMQVLRAKKPYETILKRYVKKPLNDRYPLAHLSLLLGMAQLFAEDIPDHAAVNETVSLAKEAGEARRAGLINAVLKQMAEEKETLRNEVEAMPAKEWLPAWLYESWAKAYGKEALAEMIHAVRAEPPMDVTVKRDAQGWATRLGGELVAAHSVRLPAGIALTECEGYESGEWWVQDVAASLPVQCLLDYLGGGEGKTIFDFCAAPGGKTMQLAASGASVVAVDVSDQRLKKVAENLDRTQLHAPVELIRGDLRDWHPAGEPDAILFDLPCSATGTIRRHPDIPWLKRPRDVTELAALQRQMLDYLMRWLPAGVPVMLCTCSLQPEEGEAQLSQILTDHADLALIPIESPYANEQGILRTLPHQKASGGMDGFFAALIMRNAR